MKNDHEGNPLISELSVDGQSVRVDAPGATVLEVLRANGFTGPKRACGRGECGACTVLVGDRAVMACVLLAQLVNAPVTTVAGLGDEGKVLRQAFADHAAFQCGFCTPGQIMRATALLREKASSSRNEVTQAMAGNICRCTGYVQIVDAVCEVATTRNEQSEETE